MHFKFYIVALVIFFSSLFGLSVKAADVLDQEFGSGASYPLAASTWQKVGQRFQPGQSNISQIQIFTSSFAPPTNAVITLCKGVPNNSSQADVNANLMTCNWAGNSIVVSETITPSDVGSYAVFDFTEPAEMEIGEDYYLGYFPNTPDTNIAFYELTGAGGGMILNESQWTQSIGVKLYYDDEWTPTPDWSITAISPLTGSTVATTSLQVAFNIPADEIGIINYFLQFPDYTIKQYDTVQYEGNGTSTKSLVLLDGNYSWSSYLIDYNTYTPVASTTWQNFTVKKLGSITFELPFGLSEDDVCLGVATTTSYTNLHFLGDIECGLKKTVAWALNPSESSINMLYDAYLDLQGKFPFSAYFGLTTALNDAISTTTPSTNGSIGVPMINSSGDYYILPVIASSSLGNAIGQTNSTLFRTTIGYLMWLAVGFIIFLQFKRI